MGLIETKTFRNGDHVAMDLPTEWGFAPDERFTIERVGRKFRYHSGRKSRRGDTQ